MPRLVKGGVALQALAVNTQVPRHLNLERNDGRTDDVLALAVALGWPRATWRSQLARALHLADRARAFAARSGGVLTLIASRADLDAYEARRAVDPAITAAILAIEGAHALEGDPANADVVADAGFRVVSPTHFFDNAFGGSAHGAAKGGLTDAGRELVRRLEARCVLIDLAHASAATIDDVLAIATRPVTASHTGLRRTAANARNLADAHVLEIAATGGVVGIGFWPTACGGRDAASIAHAIADAVALAGVGHLALGSDWDGAVAVPFDATGIVLVTEALLAEGFGDEEIAAIMGGNVLRLRRATLPDAPRGAPEASLEG